MSTTIASNSTDGMNEEFNIGYAIFLPILILTTAVMNIGTIIAFWKLNTLREKPSELLILNLACSDLLTGLIVLPLSAPLYITPGRWGPGEPGCIAWIFLIDISVHGTLFALMTISLDRFLLVYLEYPQYIKNVTRPRVYKILMIGWICTLLTAILEIGFWQKAKEVDETAASIDHTKHCLSPARRVQIFSLCFFLILYLLPVLLVCGLSIAFLYQLRLRLKKYRSSRNSSSIGRSASSVSSQWNQNCVSSAQKSGNYGDKNAPISEGVSGTHSGSVGALQVMTTMRKKHLSYSVIKNRYIKPGVTLVGLVSAMAVCMLPYSFYVIIIESGCEHCNELKLLYGLLLMQFLNACIDPFIYVLTRKRMRTFYRSCLWK